MSPARGTSSTLALSAVLVAAAMPCRAADAPALQPAQVFAEFTSGAGEAGVKDVRLWVDGRDVSEAADVSALRISYTPSGILAAGAHEARVVVIDALGRAFEKSWTFEVAAAVPPRELVVFVSRELVVLLDPLPARTRDARVLLAGTSQPGVEVELRRDGLVLDRVMTDPSGRFTARVALEDGLNELAVTALRLDTGESGPEARARVDREVVAVEPPPPETHPAPRPDMRVQVPSLPRDPAVSGVPPELQLDEPPRGHDEVVITKPDDGDSVVADHLSVLGRAPAGWRVEVLVDAIVRGEDVANPAGHFTVPNVPLPEGESELSARATSPDGQQVLTSDVVRVVRAGANPLVAAEPLAVAAPRRLELTSPMRRAAVARSATLRLEGNAWDGAAIEVEVNGRLAATDLAARSGRFALEVPLEPGSNTLVVEALDLRTGESVRGMPLHVTRSARALPAPRPTEPALPELRVPGRSLPRGVTPQ